jgi:hypothetical protein
MALRTPLTVTPHMYLGDSTGRPLDNGTVYFGEPNKDPEHYPIELFSNDELTTPLMQPVYTKGGYLYDKGDMVEPHAKELIYSVKVLDSYGRKVFYKGEAMRSNWNDDVIIRINEAVAQSQQIATDLATSALVDIGSQTSDTVQNAIEGVAIDANLVTDALTPIVPIATGANARTQLAKNRESVSVFDFFTKGELDAYKLDKTAFDAHRPLQAFLTYITNNDVGTARADGVFWVGAGLTLGGIAKSKTKNVVGCLVLYALNAIDIMFQSYTGHDFTWIGSLSVTGTGSIAYASRECRVGIRIGGDYDAARSQYTMLYARYFNQVGVYFENNTTLSSASNIKVYDCGSGFSYAGYSVESDYTSTRTGSQGSVAQRSLVNVDVLPPELPANMPCFVAVGDDYYYVYDIDRTAKTLNIFPWLKDAQNAGVLRYVFGAGVMVRGGDASAVQIGRIDSQRCSVALHDMALYGVSVGILCAQFVGVAYAMGNNPASASIAGGLRAFYCEGNDTDILRVSRAQLNKSISSVHVKAMHKISYTNAARFATDELTSFANMDSITLQHEGAQLVTESTSSEFSSFLSLDSADRSVHTVNKDKQTIKIREPDVDLLRNFNFGGRAIKVLGTGRNGAPDDVIKFEAPTGYTVNGLSEVSYSGFSSYAEFIAFLDPASTDIKVYCANLKSANTVTIAYAEQTIPANASVTNNVTVTGVVLGDVVAASLDKSLAGTVMSASVVSANTVAITHINPTSSSVTIAASSLKVKIN